MPLLPSLRRDIAMATKEVLCDTAEDAEFELCPLGELTPATLDSDLSDGFSRQKLQLDPSDKSVWTHVEDVQDNIITHATSPEAFEEIKRSGTFRGSISNDTRYDGYSNGSESFRCVFFMANPCSDNVVFPWSIYPRNLHEGAAIKILSVNATTLLSDDFKLFYIASTPTQFGIDAIKVYQSHIVAVHKDDQKNLERANERFKSLHKNNNALMFYHENQARIATRVLIGQRSYPNSVMVSYCNSFPYKCEDVKVLDGKRIAWKKNKVGCPWQSCDARKKSLYALKDHYRAVHLNMKVYLCTECDQSFSFGSYLKLHIASVHEKKRPHRCPQCEKSFSDRSNLETHIKSVHEKKRSHRCPTCDRRFSQKAHLQTHIASVHEKKRPHRCPQCDKSFSERSYLKLHVESVHEKKRPHRCNQCEHSFSQKANLKSHIVSVHEKKRPHRCPQCDKSFSIRSNLKFHIASVHEKKRPHRCPQCDKSFSDRSYLKLHVASVHEKKRPHRCPQCDHSFSQKTHLKTHIASVHEKK